MFCFFMVVFQFSNKHSELFDVLYKKTFVQLHYPNYCDNKKYANNIQFLTFHFFVQNKIVYLFLL